jgi:hypothetical protein
MGQQNLISLHRTIDYFLSLFVPVFIPVNTWASNPTKHQTADMRDLVK